MIDKQRDDEIKRALIADATNPDAWERIAVVPASTAPRPVWYGKSGGHASREEEALRRKQLHDAIAALPEGQRHAIQLWLDGFHYSDISYALGVSVDAVKSRLRDAKRHLRPSLAASSISGNDRDDHRTGGAKGR